LNVPPVTTLDAQQLVFPFGPHVAANPAHEGCAPQTFVLELQAGAAPLQSAFETHSTHRDVAPRSLHFGVPPPHATHVAPQLESALQTAQAPAPPHRVLLPHPVSVAA
jgi:hypothetical protein